MNRRRYSHSLFLDCEASAWACGYNMHGNLGLGDTTARNKPQKIKALQIDCWRMALVNVCGRERQCLGLWKEWQRGIGAGPHKTNQRTTEKHSLWNCCCWRRVGELYSVSGQ